MSYARGNKAWGECARSGKRVLLREMVEDGYIPGLMVARDWYEPAHPQDIPITDIADPVALLHPAPEQSTPSGEGTAAAQLTFDASGKPVWS